VSSETPVIIYQITRRHIPEESSSNENLKYLTVLSYLLQKQAIKESVLFFTLSLRRTF
jgi:hypothetical protein